MLFVDVRRAVAMIALVGVLGCLGCGGGDENAVDFEKLPPVDPSVMLPETPGPGAKGAPPKAVNKNIP